METYFSPGEVSSETKTPYEYGFWAKTADKVIPCGALRFQHDVHPDEDVNGTTMECVIEALIDRFEKYQIDAATREYDGWWINTQHNAMAIAGLSAALEAMRKREAVFADTRKIRLEEEQGESVLEEPDPTFGDFVDTSEEEDNATEE